jgi:hypothetical protein
MSILSQLVAIREELALQQITLNRCLSKVDALIENKLDPKLDGAVPARFKFPPRVVNFKQKIKHILHESPEGLSAKEIKIIGLDDYGENLSNVSQCLSNMEKNEEIISIKGKQRAKIYLLKGQ